MNYEKKYKEANDKVAARFGINIARDIFTDLYQPEDDRIRQELLSYIKSHPAAPEGHIEKDILTSWIAWLEKQEGCEYIKKDWLEHIKQSWYKEGFIDGKYNGGTSKEWTINDAATLKELIDFLENGTAKLQHDLTRYANWLKIQFTPIEKQGEQPRKVSIWKHWKDGIAGNGEGKLIYLIKNGYDYSLSSCLGFECDYIELSELDKLMQEEKQGEQKPFDYENANIQQKDFAPMVEPFDKYEGLTDFERTLADICIGWIGQELGWKQYIKDGADVLLKIAIKMFNSVQDASFEQKPTDNDMVEALRTEYEKGKADAFAEMQKPWSEEDEWKFSDILALLRGGENCYYNTPDLFAWLKSFKERIGGKL